MKLIDSENIKLQTPISNNRIKTQNRSGIKTLHVWLLHKAAKATFYGGRQHDR